jgi:DNA-binding protein H-NS
LEGGGTIYLRFFGQYLEEFPIHVIDHSNPTDKARHDRMVELVETMLKLQKQLAVAKTNHEKTAIQRQINSTDQQIDQLVYELYGLTDDEIRIVEEATTRK